MQHPVLGVPEGLGVLAGEVRGYGGGTASGMGLGEQGVLGSRNFFFPVRWNSLPLPLIPTPDFLFFFLRMCTSFYLSYLGLQVCLNLDR